jgi:alpha-glucosidase
MVALHGDNNDLIHFDVHNLYGYMQSKPTYKAVETNANETRPFVISRSTFLGSGKYGGHWTGENFSVFSILSNNPNKIFTSYTNLTF